MASLRRYVLSNLTFSLLPQPKNTKDSSKSLVEPTIPKTETLEFFVPSYLKRNNFIPKSNKDFGDGGAFPEIHVTQFPLGMGRKESKGNDSLALQVDEDGSLGYDQIIKQSLDKKVVFTKFTDLIESTTQNLDKPDDKVLEETTQKTKNALEEVLNSKTIKVTPNSKETFMRFTDDKQKTKIIKMVELPVDPIEPPKFRTKKLPPRPPSPPVTVMHSPPKKLTKEDMDSWKIPPAISNWKNPKGYTIPLDKRLAADGRGLQETQINNPFAKISDALYAAERIARADIDKREKFEKMVQSKQQQEREEKIKELAQTAREQRKARSDSDSSDSSDSEEERIQKRRRQIEIEKKKKKVKESDRDISEKIALGQPVKLSSDDQMDARLYNFDSGLNSGKIGMYDKPLFESKSSSIYRPKQLEDSSVDVDKIMKSDKFSKPTRELSGGKEGGLVKRDGPVQFERDPFGLDKFLTESKQGSKKRTLEDAIGKSGSMSVHGGSTDYNSLKASKRSKINFESSKDE
jgi:SNW domain-containing protein 1